uniref:Uncharacterized protein n=1 Tax=Parascaris equorum TaxID=6256 RepID=A0A914S3N1_PAREQ
MENEISPSLKSWMQYIDECEEANEIVIYMTAIFQERKREAEVAREKQMTAQQLAVYRRKYEEASACNRRLQQMLVKGSLRPHNQKGGQQLIVCAFSLKLIRQLLILKEGWIDFAEERILNGFSALTEE